MPPINKEQARVTLAKIRKLIAEGIPIKQIAKRTGYKYGSVGNIKNGRRRSKESNAKATIRRRNNAAIALDKALGYLVMEKVSPPLNCPKCNQATELVGEAGLCPICDLRQLLAQLLTSNPDSDTIPPR